jgi:predicted lipoprotein with Yx(FWY)xxD motif
MNLFPGEGKESRMNKGRRWLGMALLSLIVGLMAIPLQAIAADTPATTTGTNASLQAVSAVDAVVKLGVIQGDGQGVTDDYLAKQTTRLQAAILYLRLLGKEKVALAYKGSTSFSDAGSVGKANVPVLAYLKDHPELGWSGTGTGKFEPLSYVTDQQLYKVLLEALGYRSGQDFAFKDTITFAATLGLNRAAGATPFNNRNLAVALTEALQTLPKGATGTLLDQLVTSGMIAADQAAVLQGNRIDIHTTADGAKYLTDSKGMALYLYTKDMADLSTCVGACLTNWPIFYTDRLLLPEGLNAKDFGVSVRKDGAKQLTYLGWPLYYFVKDKAAGDITGEGVGTVWYLIKQPFYSVGLGTDAKLGNYLVDSKGMSLYYFDKDPKGSSVCSGDCLVKWPVFHVDSYVLPKGIAAADFGEITRADGTKQTTFKGYPLYYFFQDTSLGEIKGQAAGNVWFVVNPVKFAGTTTGNLPPAPVTDKVTIEIKDYSFGPPITVKAGTTIEFINRDDMKHNAVAVDGSFKIDLLDKGQSATIKIDKPGTYDYFCEPHKDFMKGKIIVE